MNDLEKFLSENTVDGGFLQSENWKDFQKSLSNKVYEINSVENKFRALICQRKLPLVGDYFFIPRGPAIEIQNSKLQISNNLTEIIKLARDNKAGWVRIEPQTYKELKIIKKGLNNKYQIVKSRKNHEPVQTLMVDLSLGEEEILKSMKSKTRYNIRVCGKKDLKIFEYSNSKDFDNFYKIIEETSHRNKISSYPKEYYRKMIEAVNPENIKLYLASFKKEIVAGILVSFYGDVATYLHGASSNRYRNLMAVYGLQWKAIQEAKKNGCKKYDLGGVSEISGKNKNLILNWEGITRFKRGFCPDCEVVDFPGCWDIVLNNFNYKLYRVIQRIKG